MEVLIGLVVLFLNGKTKTEVIVKTRDGISKAELNKMMAAGVTQAKDNNQDNEAYTEVKPMSRAW